MPFAGGSRYSYLAFKKHLSPQIIFTPLELPGRGGRSAEALCYHTDEIVPMLTEQLLAYDLDSSPYAIFGHSLGALLGYLIIDQIREKKKPMPLHFFVSGNEAPSHCPYRTGMHLKPKNEFFEALKSYGGIPEDLLESEDLLNYFEPVLRADFAVYENYNHKKIPAFNCPITVFMGNDDHICSLDGAKDWQLVSRQIINIIEFSGDHFFIFRHPEKMGNIISALLLKEPFASTKRLSAD